MKPPPQKLRNHLDLFRAVLSEHRNEAWRRARDWRGRGYPTGGSDDPPVSTSGTSSTTETAALRQATWAETRFDALLAAEGELVQAMDRCQRMWLSITASVPEVIHYPCSAPGCDEATIPDEDPAAAVYCDLCDHYLRRHGRLPSEATIRARLEKRAQRANTGRHRSRG